MMLRHGGPIHLLVSLMLVLVESASSAYSGQAAAPGEAAVYLFEDFEDAEWHERWQHSTHPQYRGRFVVERVRATPDKMLKIPAGNKHYGISTALNTAVDLAARPFVLQFEAKHAGRRTCGGTYIKLLSHTDGLRGADLQEGTPYAIMFGPDRCGGEAQVRLIFQFLHPRTGAMEQWHIPQAPVPPADDRTHVYTLRLTPPAQFEVLIDGELRASGDLLSDASSPISGGQPLAWVGHISSVAIEVFAADPGAAFDNIILAASDERPLLFREQAAVLRNMEEQRYRPAWAEQLNEHTAHRRRSRSQVAKWQRKGLPQIILRIFTSPAMQPLLPITRPFLDLIRHHPSLAYVAVALLLGLGSVLSVAVSAAMSPQEAPHDLHHWQPRPVQLPVGLAKKLDWTEQDRPKARSRRALAVKVPRPVARGQPTLPYPRSPSDTTLDSD